LIENEWMKLLNIFNVFRKKTTLNNKVETDSYLPVFREKDYCQIEIISIENTDYILKTFEQIKKLTKSSKKVSEFTEMFEQKEMPEPISLKDFRTDSFEMMLRDFGFEKAKNISFDNQIIKEHNTERIKAFGFSNFTIFFDTEADNEFVKNIWLSIGSIDRTKQYNLIKSALYVLGEEYEVGLADWNSLKLFDLRNLRQISKFLKIYRK